MRSLTLRFWPAEFMDFAVTGLQVLSPAYFTSLEIEKYGYSYGRFKRIRSRLASEAGWETYIFRLLKNPFCDLVMEFITNKVLFVSQSVFKESSVFIVIRFVYSCFFSFASSLRCCRCPPFYIQHVCSVESVAMTFLSCVCV